MWLFSPTENSSATNAAGPLTYALIPLGDGVSATILRTAVTDSLASLLPASPVRYAWMRAALPSLLCEPAAVSGSPQKYWTCWTYSVSARNAATSTSAKRCASAPNGLSPSSTIVIRLSESYSPNTVPTRLAATSDGASLAL